MNTITVFDDKFHLLAHNDAPGVGQVVLHTGVFPITLTLASERVNGSVWDV